MSHTMQLLKALTLDELKRNWRRPDSHISANATDGHIAPHLFEPLVNQDNSLESLVLEQMYRKMEFFLLKFGIAGA